MPQLTLLSPPPHGRQLKEDTEFQEFLSVHQKRMQTATWANDALDTEASKGKSKAASDYLNFDSDSGQESDEEVASEDPEGEGIRVHPSTQSMRLCVCPGLGGSDLGARHGR